MGTARRGKDRLPVAEFLEALDARLAALKPAQLRAALLAHAERLPASERPAFLAVFAAEGRGGAVAPGKRAGRTARPETLLRDIKLVVERYTQDRQAGLDEDAGEEDDEAYDEPAGGAWPRAEMDALFGRTDAAFRAGDLALARDAYHHLLSAVADYAGEDTDGPEMSEPEGATDLSRAKARYLRALYETTAPDQRPAALLRALEDLRSVGHEPVGLPEVIGARRGALPDRERFLEGWIDLLGRTRAEPFGFEPEIHRLLFQAVEIQRGTDGLAELARRDGRRLPEAYRQWILALAEEDKTAEAIGAAREALRDLPPMGETRAWAADFIAGEAERRRDGPARLDARREAFRGAPSIARLSALCEAAAAVGPLEGVVRAEATRLRPQVERDSKRRGDEAEEGGLAEGHRLMAMLHLLCGEADEAIALAERAPAVGWSGRDHPAPIVIPYLLLAATGGAEPAPGTALAGLWRGIDTSESLFDPWDLEADDEAFEDEEEISAPGPRPRPRPVKLTAFLRAPLQGRPPSPDRRQRFLEAAWTMAEGRVTAIVENKHRQAYDRAAELVAAVAEARILAGDPPRGQALLQDMRRRFSRFYAFTGELDKLARRSPLLPSPPSKPRRG